MPDFGQGPGQGFRAPATAATTLPPPVQLPGVQAPPLMQPAQQAKSPDLASALAKAGSGGGGSGQGSSLGGNQGSSLGGGAGSKAKQEAKRADDQQKAIDENKLLNAKDEGPGGSQKVEAPEGFDPVTGKPLPDSSSAQGEISPQASADLSGEGDTWFSGPDTGDDIYDTYGADEGWTDEGGDSYGGDGGGGGGYDTYDGSSAEDDNWSGYGGD